MTRRRLTLLGAAALVGCQGASPSPSGAQSKSAPPPATLPVAQASAQASASRRTAITDAVARVAPSVVTVQTEVVQKVAADPFEAFFGGQSGERVGQGLGSGFVIRADGMIMTNAHVVAGAQRVSVALRDGTTYPAQIMGVDEVNDLAVLKVNARDMPVAPLGRSDSLVVGEWTIAIGNPYGFLLGNTEPSVTAGVLSATGRNLVGGGEGRGVYVDMLQTDASINPGNSGGPLVNAAGEVIGVNSSIYSPTGSSIGLGFAIPMNRARRVAEDLIEHHAVRQPYVGVTVARPAAATAGRERLTGGVTLRSVVPGSPADRAGLRAGDVIMRSGGRQVRNHYDWEAELLDARVGETLPVVVTRGGATVNANITVADRPEVNAPKVQVLRELELVSLTPAIRAERGIQRARGALIYRVSDRVSEALGGVQPGDVIVQINRTPIADAAEAARAIDYYSSRGAIRMYVDRDGQVYATDFVL